MPPSISLDGLDEILERLRRLNKLNALKPALRAGATHVKGVIAVYPPASEANSPTQQRWYERGYGTKYRRKDGSIHGRKTSKTLGRRWTVSIIEGGLGAKVGNNVHYGPYVQSDEHQASFHSVRGWKTDEDVISSESDVVLNMIRKEAEEALSK